MFVLICKLKVRIMNLNKSFFGDIHDKVNSCYKPIEVIQYEISHVVFCDAWKDNEAKAQLDLDQALSCMRLFGRKRLCEMELPL